MLEGIIDKQFESNSDICGMLSTYEGQPAIFYQKAPSDSEPGWSKPCFPRIDYNIDMREDTERKISGTLVFNTWCIEENNAMPEDIAHKIIELVSGTFYTATDQTTLCALWNRTEAFEYTGASELKQNDKGIPSVFGAALFFDLMAFPVQTTTSPDPVQAINKRTKELFNAATVIACDSIPEIWQPTDSSPAVYWRLTELEAGDKNSYACSWFDCKLTGHVITDDVTVRNKITKTIAEELTAEGEIILADSSPMLIKHVIIRNSADQLREGQISLTGTYGVLRKTYASPKLNNLNWGYKSER